MLFPKYIVPKFIVTYLFFSHQRFRIIYLCPRMCVYIYIYVILSILFLAFYFERMLLEQTEWFYEKTSVTHFRIFSLIVQVFTNNGDRCKCADSSVNEECLLPFSSDPLALYFDLARTWSVLSHFLESIISFPSSLN